MTRRRDRDDAFGSQCPRHVRGALYFQKSFCHTRAWCTRRNAPPFIERSFDNSAQLSGHEAGIVPLTGGSRRVKTFQRTQFFENIERDYNEVKKLEIKVCNKNSSFFELRKRTAISNRQTSFNQETGLPLRNGVRQSN